MSSRTTERSIRALRVAALVAASIVLVAALTTIASSSSPNVFAQESKTANVIVQFDDSDTAIRAIQFSDTISGLAALELSGFDIITTMTDLGPAVCSIEGVGCPTENCFCDTKYWGYNYWDGASWQGYPVGASSSAITDTDAVEGWRWGEFGETAMPATAPLAAQAGLAWLHDTQSSADGGFGSMGASVEAAFAIGANREKATDWRVSSVDPSLANYVMANAGRFVDDNSAASGKTAIANAATEICWPFGILQPSDYYSATIGAYSEHMGFHIWGVLGALAAGDEIVEASVDVILDGPLGSGGWKWMMGLGFGEDTNTTAIAIQALVATGQPVTATEIVSGLAFLKSAQNDDGGFTYDPNSAFGTGSDTNSTAYVVQALWAAGEDAAGPAWTMDSGKSPIDYLLDMQLDDGSFQWMPDMGANPLATQQAITALLGNPQPIAVGAEACDTGFLPIAVLE